MLLRLLVIGGALAVIAALAGYRRLAIGLLVVLAIAAASLWLYMHAQAGQADQLFAPGDVRITSVQLKPVNYRPNLFLLTGTVENHASRSTLEGMSVQLQMRDCTGHSACQPMPNQRASIAVQAPPGSSANFEVRVYLDKSEMPAGRIKVQASILSLQGHRPVWQHAQPIQPEPATP